MTRHRSREERIDEILAAAVEEIDENGLPGLTMDALARRTTISKAAIYRFFRNKQEVALALFEYLLSDYAAIDVEEALSWQLPFQDTLMRCIYERHTAEERQRFERTWVQLLPATLHDPAFAERRRAGLEEVQAMYVELGRGLVAREGIVPRGGFEERLRTGVLLGTCFLEGLEIEALTMDLGEHHERYIRRFLETLIAEVLGGSDASHD